MSEERPTEWVCGACGQHQADRYAFKDVSCFLNSVECYVDTFEYDEIGRLTAAFAVGDSTG